MKNLTEPNSATRSGAAAAFTLVELLVIIAILAVLAAMLAPTMASTKDRVMRATCANNLKELGMGALTYAEHYDGRYPITQAGANPINNVRGSFYTRWVFFDGNKPGYHLPQTWNAGAPDDPDAGAVKTGTFWRNFGMLYPEKLAGNGKIFFCPGLNAKNSLLGAAFYQPFLTTSANPPDTSGLAGSVRSSYIYNPWTVKPGTDDTRLYQKISDVKGRKVFGMDYIDSNSWNTDGTVKTESVNFGHSQEGGWNILFTDNSVHFYKADFKTRQVYLLGGFPSGPTAQYDTKGICDLSRSVFEKFE